MKKRAAFVGLLVLFFSVNIRAEIREGDLSKSAPATQRGALLNQIDILSLYFSSENIKHAPRLIDNKIIEIESTVLDNSLVRDKELLQQFVMRQVTTFIRVLQERLNLYAPAVAKKFDPNADVRFAINFGPTRTPIATWKAEQWEWVVEGDIVVSAEATPAADASLNEARVDDGSNLQKKNCNCPALRKK